MKETSLLLAVDLSYDSIPTPQKFTLPIEDGKFGIFKYQQHPFDPVSVQNITFEYAGENQVKISMRGAGQLKVENFPDLKIGGTKIEAKAKLQIDNNVLTIFDLHISRLDFPNIPGFADKLLSSLFNSLLSNSLKDKLKFDLSDSLEKIQEKINEPIPINFEMGNTKYNYNILPGISPDIPVLKISQEGIQIRIHSAPKPVIVG